MSVPGTRLGDLFRRGAEVFARDAQGWGLTSKQGLMIALFPVGATLAFLAAAPSARAFRWLIDEDSLLEMLQFVLVLTTTILSALLSQRLLHGRRFGLGLLYVLLTLGTFFIAGEEISWGQRIFGWQTPERLREINAQQEISVHNIYGFHQLFIYAVMLGGLYGTVAPTVRSLLGEGRPRSTLSYLLIPPLCLVPSFFMPFGYRLYRLLFLPDLSQSRGYAVFVITEFNELTELCLYFALVVFTWLSLRRLITTGIGAPNQPPGPVP